MTDMIVVSLMIHFIYQIIIEGIREGLVFWASVNLTINKNLLKGFWEHTA